MPKATNISLREGRFVVQAWSKGRGKPLLYLHGWSGLTDWPAELDPLTKRFKVPAPQHPGFGASTGMEQLEDFIDLALYYLDFIHALGMETPVIMGHSLGANIAAEMAALSPCSVGKLVLVAPTGLWDDENPVADIFAMTDGQRQRITWHDPAGAEQRGLFAVPESEDGKRVAMLERTRSLSAAAKFLFPIPDKGLKKRIHRIGAPTLLLWGKSDRIVPASYGCLFHQSITGAQLVEVSEAGHQPLLEQPGASMKAILRFLEA